MAEHFVTTTAKEARCPRCGAATLTAHDEGMPARVDVTPLRDHTAEIVALLENRRTYLHTAYGQLHYRDETQLKKPHDPSARIHAQHICETNEQLTLNIGAK